MKAIMIMFDSLNRHMLEPYGCDWVKTPNFARLAEKTVTFDTSYVGSMPCMPARREIHTGRYNFLHRSWSPLEPFDDSMPEILHQNGIHTHLASDHYHYWEDGGATYHQRYKTWQMSRGQEADKWMGVVDAPELPEHTSQCRAQDMINRSYMKDEIDQPQAKTFTMGLDFMETNKDSDNWFLTIETFDPHEPYFSSQHYKDLYPHDYDGPQFDWPCYEPVHHTDDEVQHVRYENAALISMCDAWLGKVLDKMDELNMWDDTMLIVNTDHGFLLGEHDWWGKCRMPFYNQIANNPLFVWNPKLGVKGVHRQSLVQTIDLPATLLDYFEVLIPADMQGKSLTPVIEDDTAIRDAGLFGLFGAHVNVTDGKNVYMRAPVPNNLPLNQYTLMPTHMNKMFAVGEFEGMTLGGPFSFTKGCQVMQIPRRDGGGWVHNMETMLFTDHAQEKAVDDPELEERMIRLMVQAMKDNDAPVEQFDRLGLTEYV